MNFKQKSKLNHLLKNDITTILDCVLFFYTLRLESYIVPNVYTKLKNKIKSIGIPECTDVSISYPQTCIPKYMYLVECGVDLVAWLYA
jgi:hypothetical protein